MFFKMFFVIFREVIRRPKNWLVCNRLIPALGMRKAAPASAVSVRNAQHGTLAGVTAANALIVNILTQKSVFSHVCVDIKFFWST